MDVPDHPMHRLRLFQGRRRLVVPFLRTPFAQWQCEVRLLHHLRDQLLLSLLATLVYQLLLSLLLQLDFALALVFPPVMARLVAQQVCRQWPLQSAMPAYYVKLDLLLLLE